MKSKIILTAGVWDLFHKGHLDFLNSIKKKYPHCRLVVGVLSDKAVKQKKGNKRPIINEKERMEILKNIRIVDEVFICKYFEEMKDSVKYETERIKPDVIILGGTKKLNQSTSQIIAKIRES